ncbi:solute carrier family 51 subunit alpha [Homo sapiens]|uniref:Solute carrier family 51 member A n=2 Tax=Homininae TaxID=207598 RepID=F8WBV2_HUMAN|nr:solute carrier family 51 subunit alpha [Homo sapiens]KAI4033194.1 solute carrier family 51 subunit alpha [Homo sapiens]
MEPGRTQIKLDPRYTADLLEVLKTNYGIPSACFSQPPTAAQLLRDRVWLCGPGWSAVV